MTDDVAQEPIEEFSINQLFPDAVSIFTPIKSLEEIKDTCIVILDTNILLYPYTTVADQNLLGQCRETYTRLCTDNRLIIPGQVAREFAKNRPTKLTELYKQISDKELKPAKKENYPLLNSLAEYQELIEVEKQIENATREFRSRHKAALDKLLSQIKAWRWNDPFSSLYNEIFSSKNISEISINQEDLLTDLSRRRAYNIPPGYKDSNKSDNASGDLIIWYTIREVGKQKKQDVIFVSQEEKADWYHKGSHAALYPRYELIDEFKRYTEGKSFHIIKFSGFLELYGASEKIIEEVKEEEKLKQDDVAAINSYQAQSTYGMSSNLPPINPQYEIRCLIDDLVSKIRMFINDWYGTFMPNLAYDTTGKDFKRRANEIINLLATLNYRLRSDSLVDLEYLYEIEASEKDLHRLISINNSRLKTQAFIDKANHSISLLGNLQHKLGVLHLKI